LLAVVAVLLAAYGFNCDAMSTPEQAMKCCDSMPCSSHGHHGQDCCKTMVSMHAPFVQSSVAQGTAFSLTALAAIPAHSEFAGLDYSGLSVRAHCHAPPIFSPPSRRPLRI
jgi:hypothetical protein